MKLSLVRLSFIAIISISLIRCIEPSGPQIQPEINIYEGDPVKPADILTNNTYHHLVFNTTTAQTFGPSGKAIDNFRSFVSSRTNKAVHMRYDTISSTGGEPMDINDLKTFERLHRRDTTNGDTIFIWLAFLDTEFKPDPKPDVIFGTQYGRTSIAIFVKTLNKYTLPDMVSRFTLETFTLEHEFSHLLGLTNNGTAMASPHEDAEHKGHCNNDQCMMYWRAKDSIKLVDLLGEKDEIPILDAKCIADLQAAGGK